MEQSDVEKRARAFAHAALMSTAATIKFADTYEDQRRVAAEIRKLSDLLVAAPDILSALESFMNLEAVEIGPDGRLGTGWGTNMPTREMFAAGRAAIGLTKNEN